MKRLFDLRKEINTFMNEKGESVPEHPESSVVNRPWIFDRFNSRVKYAQCKASRKKQISFWYAHRRKGISNEKQGVITHIDEKKLDHFLNCKKAVKEAGINFNWKNDKMNCILNTATKSIQRQIWCLRETEDLHKPVFLWYWGYT